MTKIQAALEDIILKVEDYVLGLAFKFWLWLGKALDVTIEIPQPAPRVITKEVQVIDAQVAEEREELKDEVEALKAKIASYLPYVKQGADNRPKLTKAEVENIRALRRSGYSQREIAEIYDINPATVSRIVRGQYYKTLSAA